MTAAAKTRTTVDAIAFLIWLTDDCGYLGVRPLTPGRYAAILPLMFTAAIITGRIGDAMSYDDRWCYHSLQAATSALEAWDGTGEPSGWHRHPMTGRRRPEGDAEQEYVAL